MVEKQPKRKDTGFAPHTSELMVRSCRRFWWATGDLEISFGLWILALGAVIALPFGSGVASAATVLAVVSSFFILPLVSSTLRDRIIIPTGMCLKVPSRTTAPLGVVVLSVIMYLTVLVFSIISSSLITPYMAVASVGAVGLTALFAWSGKVRFFVLAAWCQVIPLVILQVTGDVTSDSASAMMVSALGVTLLASGIQALLRGVSSGLNTHDVDRLSGFLSSNDSDMRFLAAAFLCNYIEPKVIASIIRTTNDADVEVAKTAKAALSHIWGPSPEEMFYWYLVRSGFRNKIPTDLTMHELRGVEHERKIIESESRAHQREVEQVLCREVADDGKLLDDLIAIVKGERNEDESVRCVAAELLGSTREHRAYAELAKLMVSGRRELSIAAAEGFRGAESGAVAHVGPLLSHPREWVRKRAIDAMSVIFEALDESDPCDAMLARTIARKEVFLVASHSSTVTRGMAQMLLSGYREEAVELLSERCEDDAMFVRAEALQALCVASPKKAELKVIRALRDKRAHVRITALYCVSHLRIESASDLLLAMTHDPVSSVAVLAREIMLFSGSSPALKETSVQESQ